MLLSRPHLCFTGILMLAFLFGSARAEESPEHAKRTEFAKAYGAAANADARRAALATLSGCQEKASWQALFSVATMDKDKDVRAEALSVLAGCPDQDGSLTGLVVQGFQGQRDSESKAETASVVAKLPMKQPAIQALIAALTPLTYPDMPKTTRAVKAGQTDPAANIEKARNHFSSVLSAINSAGGQSFQASKTVKNEVNTWWGTKQSEFAKADQEYLKGIKTALEEKKKADAETKKAEDNAKKTEGDTKKAEEK
jgi:hypothetical protein